MDPSEFKRILYHLKSPNFNLITNIKSFEFSALYTTIPHQKLQNMLKTIVLHSFIHKNGNRFTKVWGLVAKSQRALFCQGTF